MYKVDKMQLKNKLPIATFFMGMLILTACGGGGSDSAPNPVAPAVTLAVTPAVTPAVTLAVTPSVVTTPAPSQSIEGSWSTQCQASKSLTDYDEQDIFNFKGNKLTTNKFFYLPNTNCKHSEIVLREREVAGIELGAAVNPGTNTQHTKINITTTKVILAPMNSTFTALFNNAGHTSNESIYNGYGLTVWGLNLWKDISSIDAAKTNFKINSPIHDIFQIATVENEGATHKVLKLGAQGGNVDSDSRPISLAGSITATLQEKTIQVQTPQAAGLVGTWKYACRKGKGSPLYLQNSTLNFHGNKLTTVSNFYADTGSKCVSKKLLYKVETEADIVVGKVLNVGAANEHTQIGIKTTTVKIEPSANHSRFVLVNFNTTSFYQNNLQILHYGYGKTDWKTGDWKDVSNIPDAIENLDIGTQVADIFKISTENINNVDHKVLKMGDYKGSFDINGRAMSLEAKGAVFQ